MQRIQLNDRPSQKYTIAVGETRYDVQFSYNQMADRWAVSWWKEYETCPIWSGRLIEVGMNLLQGIADDYVMLVLDRPGFDPSALNWYDRLVKLMSDGRPATWITYAAKDEWRDLLWPSTTGIC